MRITHELHVIDHAGSLSEHPSSTERIGRGGAQSAAMNQRYARMARVPPRTLVRHLYIRRRSDSRLAVLEAWRSPRLGAAAAVAVVLVV